MMIEHSAVNATTLAAEHGPHLHNPLEQFQVAPIVPLNLAGFDITITNQAMWTLIFVASVIMLLVWGVRRMALVPGRLQVFVEMTVDFASSIAKDNAGKEAMVFMPLILTLFLFVACLNLGGMIPMSFTATSQITTTGYMGVMVILMVLGVGFYTQGIKFLSIFLPHGTPWWIVPFIVPLEVISFFVRPFTLAVRLAANMVAGHVLLKVFAGFCVTLLSVFAVASAAPFVLLVALTALEVFVALLQAYIFTVLTCVYLNDALHGH